jgi:hypothetical protein
MVHGLASHDVCGIGILRPTDGLMLQHVPALLVIRSR